MANSIFVAEWEKCKEGLSIKPEEEARAKLIYLGAFAACHKLFTDIATGVIDKDEGLEILKQLQEELSVALYLSAEKVWGNFLNRYIKDDENDIKIGEE